MAQVNGFEFDRSTGNFTLYAGDTGTGAFGIARESGDTFPDTARALWTVRSPQGEIVMQRIYRLDDQYDLGDGWFLVEFHNDDTDTWGAGEYTSEIRVDIEPIWDGTPNEGRCVDAMAPGAAHMIEGIPVRTVFKGRVTIKGVDGRI